MVQVYERRSAKLDRRRLTAVYGGQAVMTSTLSPEVCGLEEFYQVRRYRSVAAFVNQ